ncbi:uncharacterized protein LOC129952285 [Eupeodes corollae]|uniref:uncharacterized protein LOC129952285 n=1 Tax=Eupeodes corollae TaxID=290404 RepID=UPI002490F83C|nr:uncharacterized protein LOC129952285 [Eupeodes corollae]XP_055920774.1 uncharacterized protein LOC129952285 [Eupeodes corollae]
MIVEFVIIQLIFVRSRRRRLVMTRKRSEPSGSVAVVADWYFKNLVKERSVLRPGTKERYREWKIYTGDESLFTVDGILYEQVYVFMGLTTYYWIFFRKEPEHIRKHGSAPLTCSYCGCCVYSHVPRIIENVKECIKLNIPDENNKEEQQRPAAIH